MKKILIFTLIVGLLFVLTSCCGSKQIALDNGQTVEVEANFYIIKTLYHGYYDVRLCYDPETKVMYYMIGNDGSCSFGVSPYYLPNGVVGIYGKKL